MLDPDFRHAADCIQSSGVLGEARLRRLFDYLVETSTADHAPKEIAIAIDVFDRDGRYDSSQDALVRVYIHKLRKALASFQADPGNARVPHLEIPRGQYRLALVPQSPAAPALALAKEPMAANGAFWRRWRWLTAGVIGLCLGLALGLVTWRLSDRSQVDDVRSDPVWAAVLHDDRPLMLVVGDYYLIGETDASMEITRLIREYSVNSSADLKGYVTAHPEVSERYMDVGLRYVPTSTAYALANIIPIVKGRNRRVSIVTMSALTPTVLKTHNIVYIGYLSGLGLLRDLVFNGSHFAIGESDDEVRDKVTRHVYVSQTVGQNVAANRHFQTGAAYRDYGFFATFRGPGGNAIMAITGTRDEGVRQTAETLATPDKIRELTRRIPSGQGFDALLEVSALDGVNLAGKLVVAAQRDPAR